MDCLNNDQAIYHSDCPSTANCRDDDIIDLSSATSYKTPKLKTSPTTASTFETQMLQFMERQNNILQSLASNNTSKHNRPPFAPRQITNNPNENWQSWTPAELQKAKDDAAVAEGCQIGSKGPWSDSDPVCKHCTGRHHSANCRGYYPWLRRFFNNYRGPSNYRGRGRGGYQRGYPRRNSQPYTKPQ